MVIKNKSAPPSTMPTEGLRFARMPGLLNCMGRVGAGFSIAGLDESVREADAYQDKPEASPCERGHGTGQGPGWVFSVWLRKEAECIVETSGDRRERQDACDDKEQLFHGCRGKQCWGIYPGISLAQGRNLGNGWSARI